MPIDPELVEFAESLSLRIYERPGLEDIILLNYSQTEVLARLRGPDLARKFLRIQTMDRPLINSAFETQSILRFIRGRGISITKPTNLWYYKRPEDTTYNAVDEIVDVLSMLDLTQTYLDQNEGRYTSELETEFFRTQDA